MEDVRLLKHTIRGLNYRYNALKKINSYLGEAKDIKEFLDNILGIVMEIVGAEAGVILTREVLDCVKIQAFRAEVPFEKEKDSRDEIEGVKIPLKDSGLRGILDSRENVQINNGPDLSINYRKPINQALGKVENLASVLIKVKKEVTGIIELYNIAGSLGDDKQETLASVGAHVGASMELFKRLTMLQERTNVLRELTSITEAISSPYQINMVLDVILSNSKNFFEADGCSVLLNDEEGNPEFAAVVGESAPTLKGQKLKKGEGIAGWVIENNDSVLVADVSRDERFSSGIDSMTGMSTGSIICAPLKVVNEVTGVIEIVRAAESKPFKEEDLGMLEILASHASLAIDKAHIFTQKDRWFKSTVELLSGVIGIKDGEFPENRSLVKKYVSLLGWHLNLNSEELELLDLAASVQDIGKLVIPEKILKKESELSEEEWSMIKMHPIISVEILQTVDEFKEIVPIIKHHHENYDGTGYPEGISGEEIPKLARILSIADAYAAMLSRRPYRNSLTKEEAKRAIIEQKGRQFDPKFVDEFIKVLDKEKGEGKAQSLTI